MMCLATWNLFFIRITIVITIMIIIIFNLVLKHQTENGQWYQHLLTLFAFFFYERNPEGINFRISFICFTFVKCACLVLYSTYVRFDWVKSPEVTLCGWLGYKPSIYCVFHLQCEVVRWTLFLFLCSNTLDHTSRKYQIFPLSLIL